MTGRAGGAFLVLAAILWTPLGLAAPPDLFRQVNERPLGSTQIRHTRMTLTAPTEG